VGLPSACVAYASSTQRQASLSSLASRGSRLGNLAHTQWQSGNCDSHPCIEVQRRG
jgi:hypothetical protein